MDGIHTTAGGEGSATLHERLAAIAKKITLARTEDIPAQESECLYILTEGILRVWLLDPQGNDVTDSFVWRPWQVASTAPRPETAGISETVTALVPSRVLVIPVEAARSLCAENPAFAREYLETIRAMYLALWEHKSVLMTLDAAARYRWFLERYPGMIDRVKHKLIASFLGMTPVSLSRIRGKLRDQGE